MFANVVSAGRRIGGTVVIGYFWQGLLWFLIKPHLPGAGAANEQVATAYRLAEALAKPGVVIVGTFAAYLIGTLTVQLLMPVLQLIPIPRNTRTIFLPRPEAFERRMGHLNFRPEGTKAYVARGLLPPEYYELPNFREAYMRLCAEARFLWAAPVPLAMLGVYASLTFSRWFIVPTVLAPVLMFEGQRRFVWACRLLSRVGLGTARVLHDAAMLEWDERNGRIGPRRAA